MLRFGIVGCGFIANGKHMPSLAKFPEKAKIVAFCDLIEERAQKAAGEYGDEEALVCTDYRRLLERKDIDVVCVCTPNVSHCRISCDAMKAGKHVICEKPMAINSAEAREMLNTSRQTGRKLTIGYQCRFREDAVFLKNVVDDGLLGDLYYGKAFAVRRRAVPTWGVFTDKEAQGGGPLIDIGTHALDLTLWYLNDFDVHSVNGVSFFKLGRDPEMCWGNASGPWDPATYDVEDSAMGFIRMKSGRLITLESSWALNTLDVREAKCAVSGTKGGAEMYSGADGSDQCKLNLTMGKKLVTVYPTLGLSGQAVGIGAVDPSVEEARRLIESIEEDKPVANPPEQSLVVTQILEAIYTSASTGREVIFD